MNTALKEGKTSFYAYQEFKRFINRTPIGSAYEIAQDPDFFIDDIQLTMPFAGCFLSIFLDAGDFMHTASEIRKSEMINDIELLYSRAFMKTVKTEKISNFQFVVVDHYTRTALDDDHYLVLAKHSKRNKTYPLVLPSQCLRCEETFKSYLDSILLDFLFTGHDLQLKSIILGQIESYKGVVS